jgi:excisionase family DNA binding protein
MSRLLRVSTDIGYGLVHKGAVPVIRIGRQFRIPRAALLQQLKETAMANVVRDGTTEKTDRLGLVGAVDKA